MFLRSFLALGFAALAVSACATPTEVDDDGAAQSEDEVVVGGIRARATDPCTATFVFLQKDAYKETGGRSSALWPPHTTTVLEVSCQTARGEQRIAPYKENYGTAPGKKDAQGNDMLERVDMDPEIVTTEAPWSKMKKLVASYQSCGCDPAGFLGLDTIDTAGQAILEKLLPILSCADPEEAILLALKDKRFDEAKAMAARCTLRQGATAEDVARAAATVEAEVKTTFAENHVCNNNALLQMDLFARFRDGGDATACNPHDAALCYGPKLLFDPAREVR